jgi:hypothetical protein
MKGSNHDHGLSISQELNDPPKSHIGQWLHHPRRLIESLSDVALPR